MNSINFRVMDEEIEKRAKKKVGGNIEKVEQRVFFELVEEVVAIPREATDFSVRKVLMGFIRSIGSGDG